MTKGIFSEHGHNEDRVAKVLGELMDEARDMGCCPRCIAQLLLSYSLALATHVLDEPDPYAWMRKQGEMHRAMASAPQPVDGRLN